MWREIITYKDMEKIALLRNDFGCVRNYTADLIKGAIERKTDCHFYYYESDTIELIKGYKLMGDYISIITFTIKADVKDYPKALRLMAEKSKEYLESREIKKMIIGFGSKDETSVNFHNIGIGKMGFAEVVKIAKIEYEKLGFKLTFDNKQLIAELV